MRSRKVLSTGASFPMELEMCHPPHLWMLSPTWKLLAFCNCDIQLMLLPDVEGRALSLGSGELIIILI